MAAFRPLLFLTTTLGFVRVNQASLSSSRFGMRLASKDEIMASMTMTDAATTVMNMSSLESKPQLMSLIEDNFAHLLNDHAHTSRSWARKHSEQNSKSFLEVDTVHEVASLRGISKKNNQPSGYGGVSGANDMLNTMLLETSEKMETLRSECDDFNKTKRFLLKETRRDVISLNSKAVLARSMVLKADAAINLYKRLIPKTEEELRIHRQSCEKEIKDLKLTLKIVRADVVVMEGILNITECNTTAMFLVQCAHCGGQVMLQHEGIQSLMNKLSSSEAQERLRHALGLSYEESSETSGSVSLSQEKVDHMMRFLKNHNQTKYSLNVSDVPEPVEIADCVPTQKCTIGTSPNCQRLRDRFSNIHEGLEEKSEELDEEINDKEAWCRKEEGEYVNEIDTMTDDLEAQETALSVALADQGKSEDSAHTKAKLHTSLSSDYTVKMASCCDETNQYLSEKCALEKIRGQLDKIAGVKLFVIDCEVSDWNDGDCTATCGGGSMVKRRSVIVHPQGGGMPCLPLEERVTCNEEACPIDCVQRDWSDWSGCSAECGGGSKLRFRSTVVDPAHEGEPCGADSDTQPCGTGACDADCDLSDWSDWGDCSRPCGAGSRRSIKTVLTPARGDGECYPADDVQRLKFDKCKVRDCEDLLFNSPREILRCTDMVDVILLIDGSGSVGWNGWEKSIEAADKLIKSMQGGDYNVKMSTLLFSGPKYWWNYHTCLSYDPSSTLDLWGTCGIKWASHFTSDMTGLAESVRNLDFPQRGTLTSLALGEALSEIKNGRANAETNVVVITDGYPARQKETAEAAERLIQAQANILWVAVGAWAPIKLMQQMASKPQEEHVLQIDKFASLTSPQVLNNIIRSVCHKVE